MKKFLIITLMHVCVAVSAQIATPNQSIQPTSNPETNYIGIGTQTPNERLHVAGHLRIGKNEAGTEGVYHINMPDGSASVNGGNGRDLVITAGSSDNHSQARGGR